METARSFLVDWLPWINAYFWFVGATVVVAMVLDKLEWLTGGQSVE